MNRKRTLVAVMLVSSITFGCGGPQLGTLEPGARSSLRQRAIKCLEGAAFGESGSLRMQSLEAFGKVAPKEGIDTKAIPANIESEYPGASFAALMAAGESESKSLVELVRTRSESGNDHVRIAALFALHEFGERGRTAELATYLLEDPDPAVRSNAALAIGRLRDPAMMPILTRAMARERDSQPKMQIREALAMLGDKDAIKHLMFVARSAIPQDATIALMMLANAGVPEAEELFWLRMADGEFPEVRVAALRGLGLLGKREAMKPAIQYLYFNSPNRSAPNDPPEQQINRIRGMAALALEGLAAPEALKPLEQAFDQPGQTEYVRVAVARAIIKTIDTMSGRLPRRGN